MLGGPAPSISTYLIKLDKFWYYKTQQKKLRLLKCARGVPVESNTEVYRKLYSYYLIEIFSLVTTKSKVTTTHPSIIELVHLQVYVKRNLSMRVFVKTSLLLKNKFASSIDESIC